MILSRDAKEDLDWWQHHLTHWNGRAVIQRQAQVRIQSDTSLTGWGAVCDGVSTGGTWSLQEKTMHINCLELLAADLTMKAFLKERHGISVLLQLDNSTAVAYINNLGGTVSSALTSLAKALWLWALERDILITAQHIPGVSNTVADLELRSERDWSDWMLAYEVFQKINQIFGPLEVDLFASRLTHQIPRFFSWKMDPLAEAVDAFQQDWKSVNSYANLPWCLIGHVLNNLGDSSVERSSLVSSSPKDAKRLSMTHPSSGISAAEGGGSEGTRNDPSVSRVACLRERYRVSQLQTSCLPPEGRSPLSHMSPSLASGLADVHNGVLIPSQDL